MRRRFGSWYHQAQANKWLIISLTSAAVLVSTLASWSLFEIQNRERERAFQEISDTVFGRLELTIGGWIALGESGRDLVQLSEGITSENFWEFSKRLTESHPVIKAADYMPRVLESERAEFERGRSLEYDTDFSIREFDAEGKLVPAGRRPEYYPASDARLRGWDIGTDPNLGPAMDTARDYANPAAVFIPSPLDPNEFRIAVAYPIFDSNEPSMDIVQRRNSIVAFTLLIMGIRDLVDQATFDSRESVAVQIAGEIKNQPTLLYSQNLSQTSTRTISHTFNILGTEWRATTTPLDGIPGRWPDQFPVIFSVLFSLAITASALAATIILSQRKGALAQAATLRELSETKTRFLSTVSHELKTPLTSVIAFTDIVLRNPETNLTDGQIAHLSIVQRNGHHLKVLIDDLLDVSRIHAGNLRIELAEFDVALALRDLIAGLTPTFDSKHQTVRSEIAEGPIWLTGDKDRIEQVVSNLLSNASKYSPDGTEVTIRAKLIGDALQISVRDRGIGIASEDVDRVFEPFFRVDNSGTMKESGNGLGLFITKSIVELHGGVVDIESVPDVGTTVTVTIPGVIDEPTSGWRQAVGPEFGQPAKLNTN